MSNKKNELPTDDGQKGAAWSAIDEMVKWEEGLLDEAATIVLFQYLVDNGMAWSLQGCYGREAKRLIDAGLVKSKE